MRSRPSLFCVAAWSWVGEPEAGSRLGSPTLTSSCRSGAGRAAAASGAAARRRVEADVGETISKVRGASGVVVPNKQRSVAIGRSGTRLGQDTTTTATGEPRATRPAASAVGRRALQPTRIGLQ
jgi:hypothetical protein